MQLVRHRLRQATSRGDGGRQLRYTWNNTGDTTYLRAAANGMRADTCSLGKAAER